MRCEKRQLAAQARGGHIAYFSCYYHALRLQNPSDVTTIDFSAPFGSVLRSCTDLADLPHPVGSISKENDDGYWHRQMV